MAFWDELLEGTRRRAKAGTVTAGDIGRITSSRQRAEMGLYQARAFLLRTKRDLGLCLNIPIAEAERFEAERLQFADHRFRRAAT